MDLHHVVAVTQQHAMRAPAKKRSSQSVRFWQRLVMSKRSSYITAKPQNMCYAKPIARGCDRKNILSPSQIVKIIKRTYGKKTNPRASIGKSVMFVRMPGGKESYVYSAIIMYSKGNVRYLSFAFADAYTGTLQLLDH